MWKEAVVAYFEVLFQHFLEGLKRTTENVTHCSWSPFRYDVDPGLPEHNALTLPTRPRRSVYYAVICVSPAGGIGAAAVNRSVSKICTWRATDKLETFLDQFLGYFSHFPRPHRVI
jgi:hypothetical protein